jgi:hypothetical protein
MKSAKVANAAKRANATSTQNATNATDQTFGRARVRARATALTLAWLRDHSSPRVAMSLMMACTVGCGFLASIVMHRLGITSPLIRYPLVVLIAWAVFLLLVGVWVWWHRRIEAQHVDYRDEHPSYRYDLGDADHVLASNAQGLRGVSRANAANDGVIATAATDRIAANTVGNEQWAALPRATRGSSSRWDANFDGDDAAFLIIFVAVIAVAFTVFGVVFYAVYSAPAFFAELLIDGGVGTWIVKRMNVAHPTDAMSTAIKRSAWPVIVLIAIFVALALAMHYATPDATTLVEVWRIMRNR